MPFAVTDPKSTPMLTLISLQCKLSTKTCLLPNKSEYDNPDCAGSQSVWSHISVLHFEKFAANGYHNLIRECITVTGKPVITGITVYRLPFTGGQPPGKLPGLFSLFFLDVFKSRRTEILPLFLWFCKFYQTKVVFIKHLLYKRSNCALSLVIFYVDVNVRWSFHIEVHTSR